MQPSRQSSLKDRLRSLSINSTSSNQPLFDPTQLDSSNPSSTPSAADLNQTLDVHQRQRARGPSMVSTPFQHVPAAQPATPEATPPQQASPLQTPFQNGSNPHAGGSPQPDGLLQGRTFGQNGASAPPNTRRSTRAASGAGPSCMPQLDSNSRQEHQVFTELVHSGIVQSGGLRSMEGSGGALGPQGTWQPGPVTASPFASGRPAHSPPRARPPTEDRPPSEEIHSPVRSMAGGNSPSRPSSPVPSVSPS